jgi:predicted unusual protein kinase regulating ubiquinone biosynthesis (AarF/ABC1/UbiB family)
MAGEFALGGLAEGARRAVGVGRSEQNAFLTGEGAEKLARRLANMRGAAMKLGQLLSLEGDDLLPPEFAEALAVLRASADTMPPAQVRRALGRAYGKGWESLFEEFDFDPIASASIGQVHRALAKDGREIALKIQYPGVAQSIDSDVDNLASLLRLTRILPIELETGAVIDEAKRQLRQEADYELEASHMERFGELLEGVSGLSVPRVYRDLTRKRVLAMERSLALPMEELRGPDHSQELRDAIGTRLVDLMYRELFDFRVVQTDPNFANYLFDAETRDLVLLDFGSTMEFEDDFMGHYARMCRAMIEGDATAAHEMAVAIGYLGGNESPGADRAFTDLVMMVGEPMRCEGPFDFGSSDLAQRARDAGFDLAVRQGFLRAPPPKTIFLHRKLGGTFLLCARIRAQVDVKAIAGPYIDRFLETTRAAQ